MPPKGIAQRRIEIYLPSLETREEWVAAAAKRGTSLSEFVFDVVHTSLTGQGGDLRKTVNELRDKTEALTTQLAEERRRIEELQLLKDRYEHELEEYRAELFLTKTGSADPVAQIDPRVVRVFTDAKDARGKARAVSEDELRRMFRVTAKDIQRNKWLNRQVQMMEGARWITKSSRGWTWHG